MIDRIADVARALARVPLLLALAPLAFSPAHAEEARAGEPDDARIRADVIEALTRDAFVERYGIDVFVEDAVVTLHGSVPHAYERDQAAEVARRVDGVEEVDNRIVAGEVNLEAAPEPLP